MAGVRVEYRPNPEFYDTDVGFFYGDFVFDVEKLEEFANRDHGTEIVYSDDEAKKILRAMETDISVECHDKYSFFDTDWEREEVLSKDGKYTSVVTVFLNS